MSSLWTRHVIVILAQLHKMVLNVVDIILFQGLINRKSIDVYVTVKLFTHKTDLIYSKVTRHLVQIYIIFCKTQHDKHLYILGPSNVFHKP